MGAEQEMEEDLIEELEEIEDTEEEDETEAEETEESEETEEVETKEEEETDEQEEEGELVVTIGDEEPEENPQEKAPSWVREVREQNRELKRQLKEATKANQEQQPGAIVLGKKPAMADDDIDFDEEKFERKLDEWHNRKRQVEAQDAELNQQKAAQAKEWEGTLTKYEEKKTELNVADYDIAEDAVKDTLSEMQQNIILHSAKNPALMVLALGRNEGKAKELAGITDHIKFAYAVAELETQLKTAKRKPATKPEKTVKGGVVPSSNTEKKLEALEKEADKSGDRSKVVAFKKKLKQQNKQLDYKAHLWQGAL